LSLDEGAETFSALADIVCRFNDAWEAARQPPSLAGFLPEKSSLRLLALGELIKADLEYRWLRFNHPKRITEYRAEFQEHFREGLPVDLIYEEFHIRRQTGLNIDPAEYLAEFPEHADALRNYLGLEHEYHSTMIVEPGEVRAIDAVEAGKTIDDFELLVMLGKGAFARVFLARQKSMQRLVAVKVSADSGTEPQTLAQLDHDYIVRVFDQRVLAGDKLRLLYMQYLPGGTLQTVVERVKATEPSQRSGALLLDVVDAALERRGELRPASSSVRAGLASLSWPETIAWLGARLASALDYAHGRGVLHRDIKPANVLLTSEAEPKLADFNISFSENVTGATPAEFFGGSLAYMSPEQLEAFDPRHARKPEELDGRADIYSLGVMLWELLSGQRPFMEERVQAGRPGALQEMLDRRLAGVPPAAADRLPADCPATLQRVLRRCLAPLREDRWRRGSELARQFQLCLDPRACALVDPRGPRAVAWQLKFAVPILLLMVLIPNAFAAVFNHWYNDTVLIKEKDAHFQLMFDRIKIWVNGAAFPIGIAVGTWLTGRIARVVVAVRGGGRIDPQLLAQRRVACLRMAHHAALICLSLWAVAGIAYPVALQLTTPAGSLPASYYPHFFSSLVICGLSATVYPFFLLALFTVRRLYPAFVQRGLEGPDDAVELERLDRQLFRYLLLAALVPLIALLGLLIALFALRKQLAMNVAEPLSAFTMLGLCVGGIVFGSLAYWCYRELQGDIAALLRVVGDRRQPAL
jgi:serine/threonine protein kinase